MMIWSIIPTELIFEGADQMKAPRYLNYQGKKLLVTEGADGKFSVMSLLSSDPSDFLDARFAPGSVVDLNN